MFLCLVLLFFDPWQFYISPPSICLLSAFVKMFPGVAFSTILSYALHMYITLKISIAPYLPRFWTGDAMSTTSDDCGASCLCTYGGKPNSNCGFANRCGVERKKKQKKNSP